jgi:hypothetical protein
VETKEARKVLDDFYQSKVLQMGAEASPINDVAARGRLMADHFIQVSEKFGIGEVERDGRVATFGLCVPLRGDDNLSVAR